MMDDLPAHKSDNVRRIIEAAGASLIYLRKAAERSMPALWDRIGSMLNLFAPTSAKITAQTQVLRNLVPKML